MCFSTFKKCTGHLLVLYNQRLQKSAFFLIHSTTKSLLNHYTKKKKLLKCKLLFTINWKEIIILKSSYLFCLNIYFYWRPNKDNYLKKNPCTIFIFNFDFKTRVIEFIHVNWIHFNGKVIQWSSITFWSEILFRVFPLFA